MGKKTIKIKFVSCGNEVRKGFLLKLLNKHFNVEICDNPEFIIAGNEGIPFEYMRYDCVRINIMTENFSPDFTIFDYTIGFDDLKFGDRYFRLPLAMQFNDGIPWKPDILSIEQANSIMHSKEFFCNFIYRHASAHGIREALFEKLSKYKHVVSPGNFKNNIIINKKENEETIDYPSKGGRYYCSIETKKEFLKKSKFTIACDSVSYPGFVTEKIVDAFRCHSIPIYFGSPSIINDFNKEAFIWCKSMSEIDETVEKIIYLDKHDDAYMSMLMQCPLIEEDDCVNLYNKLEDFLFQIFSQNIQSAKRRPSYYLVDEYNSRLKQYAEFWYKHEKPYRKKIRDLIRNIKLSIKKKLRGNS